MLEGREWHSLPPATEAELTRLRETLEFPISASFFELLAWSNGGEGPLTVDPLNFCLDRSDMIVSNALGEGIPHLSSADFLVFGGNGGGDILAFDLRSNPPFPIVTIDLIVGVESAQHVAADFDEFLSFVGHS